MKKVVVGAVILSMGFGLTACQTKQESGTLLGAGTGALIGSQFGGGAGKLVAMVGGAALGGYFGGKIGQSMDRQDQLNMQSAIVNTPVNQSASWTNDNSGTTYTVTPVRNYAQGDSYCREYQTKVTVGGKVQNAYGNACRQPDGSWKMMS